MEDKKYCTFVCLSSTTIVMDRGAEHKIETQWKGDVSTRDDFQRTVVALKVVSIL